MFHMEKRSRNTLIIIIIIIIIPMSLDPGAHVFPLDHRGSGPLWEALCGHAFHMSIIA